MLMFLFESSGQRRGPGALGQIMRVLIAGAHGLGDFDIADFDNTFHVVQMTSSASGLGVPASEAIRDDGARRSLDHVTGFGSLESARGLGCLLLPTISVSNSSAFRAAETPQMDEPCDGHIDRIKQWRPP